MNHFHTIEVLALLAVSALPYDGKAGANDGHERDRRLY